MISAKPMTVQISRDRAELGNAYRLKLFGPLDAMIGGAAVPN